MIALVAIGLNVAWWAVRGIAGSRTIWFSLVLLPLTAVGAYLSALSLRDRYAAVVAGVLIASSGTLATVIGLKPALGVGLVCVAIVWRLLDQGQVIPALAACVLALLFRFELVSLGLVVLAYVFSRRSSQSARAVVLFGAGILGALATHILGHHRQFLPADALSRVRDWGLLGPGLPILWFLTAFVTDMADRSARSRWLPLVAWLFVSIVGSIVCRPSGSVLFLAPAIVGCYILCAAGIARVLPALAGDLPTPAGRYAVAALAVLLLIGLRVQGDRHVSAELRSVNHRMVETAGVTIVHRPH